MDCGTPGSLVLHRLLELAQTHVHWVVAYIKINSLLWLKIMPMYVYHILSIFLTFYLFIFDGAGSSLLHMVFLELQQVGATLCCGGQAFYLGGFSCCSIQALGCQGLVAPRHVESSWTKLSSVLAGRFHHWSTREAPVLVLVFCLLWLMVPWTLVTTICSSHHFQFLWIYIYIHIHTHPWVVMFNFLRNCQTVL